MQTMESFENPSKLSILRGRGIRSIIVGHASRSSSSDTLFQITSPLTEKRSPSRITDRSSGNSRRLSRYVLCLDFRNENGVTARDSNYASDMYRVSRLYSTEKLSTFKIQSGRKTSTRYTREVCGYVFVK